MTTKELKKLSNEFSKFLEEENDLDLDLELEVAEFWGSKFGVQNEERQQELLDFWLKD